jgi:D-arabinose 5-phosphate isomerase GutQ
MRDIIQPIEPIDQRNSEFSRELESGNGKLSSESSQSAQNTLNSRPELQLHCQPRPLVDHEINESTLRIVASSYALASVISCTAAAEQNAIDEGIGLISRMIITRAPVRIVGVGRARLAIAMPANRLKHALADVHLIYDDTPLPNTVRGGFLIAGSASGKTKEVLDVMRTTRRLNTSIRILGFADCNAQDFRELCHVFVGIHTKTEFPNPISALADLGEHAISQLFDRMVVVAAHRLGLNDEDMRLGHEDLNTGPYSPTQRIPT